MKTHLLTLTPMEFCDQTKACEEGRIFASKHKTMSAVWANCPNSNWLLWILDAIDAPPDEKNLRLFAIWCARSTPLSDGRKTGDLLTDPISLNALDVAERFAHGQATERELDVAWDAAWDATWGAAREWRAAAWAARAAAWAAQGAAQAAAQDAAWGAQAAAQTAAREAREVRVAAQGAASGAQAAQFKKMIANPFR